MSPVLDNIKPKKVESDFKEDPLPAAHFLERQLVHPKWEWKEATRKLAEAFPRQTRPERPRPWYGRLAGTHWPDQVPPGNGPFYLPLWTFPEEKIESYQSTLEDLGFKEAVAHVVMLPHNNEYLAAAMRAAGDHPWTANPVTYRAYVYPKLKRKLGKRELRPFNAERTRF